MTKFIIAITLMITAILSLSYTAFSLEGYHVSTLLFIQGLNFIECYAVLGIGLGLPIVLLASVLGWVQLLLLLICNIPAHLPSEGLINVIKKIFTEFCHCFLKDSC